MITLSNSLLEFANLERVESCHEVDDIFRRHARPPLWNPAVDGDVKGFDDLVRLHAATTVRLRQILSRDRKGRRDVLQDVLRELPNSAAQASVQGIPIGPLPCVPAVVLRGNRVTVEDHWLCTGAHNAVMLGLLELYVNDLIGQLATCAWCDKFFLAKTKKIVVCSPACWWERRKKKVARNVKKHRQEQRKKRQENSVEGR